MKLHSVFPSFLVAAIVTSGCAATKVTSDWKDPSYHDKPGKILVVAVLNDPIQRRLMENELAGRLQKEGVNAVPGYTIIADNKPGKDVIDQAVREAGADALFITTVVDRKAVQEQGPNYYPPPGSQDWHTYFEGMYSPYPAHSPPWMTPGFIGPYPSAAAPRYREDMYNVAQAYLYDAETERLAWSARTETMVQGEDKEQFESYASGIVDRLRRQDLIG